MGESQTGQYLEKESWWSNEDVQEAVKKKKEAFKRWKTTREKKDRETYKSMNNISKIEAAKAKERKRMKICIKI